MFSTIERLKKRTPAGGINREEYIEHLVNEFHTTTNVEAQEQVTANLANFAYDPVNYFYLKKSDALNVFLQILNLPNENLVLHGIAGICNLCVDDYFQDIIIQPENLSLVFKLLNKNHTEIVSNTITTLALIINSNKENKTKDIICKPEVIQNITKLKGSKNIRVQKLATLFIQDYCTKKTEIVMTTTPSSTSAIK